MSFTKTCSLCGGSGIGVTRTMTGREEECNCPACNGRGLTHEDVDRYKRRDNENSEQEEF